ncbi:MAG: RNA 2',3'-cyclic phosphodiesterase [Wenzhouxiangellaceae bacterium]|nr:RNA 2',3'-cyclic phosphodiesterase [Wenzhouxiangellaceae bacterium]
MTDVRRRFFFALWPDPALRSEIVRRRQAVQSLSPRRVPDQNLHLTLIFLGAQPENRMNSLLVAVDDLKSASFELLLDRFGWFAGARVAWLGGMPAPAGLLLVRRLALLADSAGLEFDRRNWQPHVTLFRKVMRQPAFPEPAPLHWPVRDFSLIESVAGQPYQVLRTWSLQSQ